MSKRVLFLIWASACLSWVLMLVPYAALRLAQTPFRLWQELANEAERKLAIRALADTLNKRMEQERAILTAKSRVEVN